MPRNTPLRHKTILATLAAATLSAALPVSAALWPAPAEVRAAQTLDLSLYDEMPRIGSTQLPTDPYCDHRPVLVMNLTETYDEAMVLSALNGDMTRFDLWASDDAGTWTITYTRADGVACVVGSGVDWQPGGAASSYLARAGIRL